MSAGRMRVCAIALLALLGASSQGIAREDESLLLIVAARGVHHWVCDAPAAPNVGPAWRVDRVELHLLESNGQPVGKGGGLRTWEMADGTRLSGQYRQQSELPPRDDLPWLELRADGARGKATRVAQVMRFGVGDGRPAPEGCTATRLGVRALLPWTGEYYFFMPA